MTLCLNCLDEHHERPTPVGHEQGSQRDPVRRELSLCADCREALLTGQLDVFASSYAEERRICR